jgi:hypothetical protein
MELAALIVKGYTILIYETSHPYGKRKTILSISLSALIVRDPHFNI